MCVHVCACVCKHIRVYIHVCAYIYICTYAEYIIDNVFGELIKSAQEYQKTKRDREGESEGERDRVYIELAASVKAWSLRGYERDGQTC